MREKSRAVIFLPCCLIVLAGFATGGAQTRPVEGIRENAPRVHALVNAKIMLSPGQAIERGVLVIREGIIEAVGEKVEPPADARKWDYQGLVIYPGLIEPYFQIEAPRDTTVADTGENPAGPTYWNPQIRPETTLTEGLLPDTEDLRKLRSAGFTAALLMPDQGIFGGSGALVNLGEGSPNERLLRDQVVQQVLFQRPKTAAKDSYPTSLMGTIALIRQTLYDAQWYRSAHEAYALNPAQPRPEFDQALEALGMVLQGRQPLLFRVENDLNLLRALKVAEEFDLRTWLLGSGHEYRQIERLKTAGAALILPLNFPKAPAVDSPEAALSVSLMDLQHWDMAPENPGRLHRAGISFALTTAKLENPEDFYQQLRQAIQRGLPEEAALAALTSEPAKILGVEDLLGSIAPGKLAHLVVADGDLFRKDTHIFDVWVDGNRYEVQQRLPVDLRGKWQLSLALPRQEPLTLGLELTAEDKRLKGSLLKDSIRISLQTVTLDHRRLILVFPGDSLGITGVIRMSGAAAKKHLAGRGVLPDGGIFEWTADWQEALQKEKPESPEEPPAKAQPESLAFGFPGAYGYSRPPLQPRHLLVQGASIWTCGPRGRLEEADMLISAGKIVRIDRDITPPPGALIIDARGKHLTPGLIDAHSHMAISQAVNEAGQAVTAEVRIRDVINPYDITIYRQLAGGLTVAHLLHGSANPIGGQNAVIKLRWGAPPEELLFHDAPTTIKFALGENVKQSNWGDQYTTRYPQTRMGVEQIIRDRFRAARDYEKEWQAYNARRNKKGVIPPRRDLELQALLEVLNGQRIVHCHSYRQDEILMLMRVAEDFGFRIGTFQHVLEGYKVADIMAHHGAHASTFSDWWAYKFEVYDAIPYNGALMNAVGILVSFNSDDDELGRRMNLEAAKAVKYGGVSEEEALKFVTLNPAIQLRIDHRVGSLEPGKDADFVIWSGHPLSTYSICEQTFIDGRKYFDRDEDMKMQEAVMQERTRLIQKVLTSKNKKKADSMVNF